MGVHTVVWHGRTCSQRGNVDSMKGRVSALNNRRQKRVSINGGKVSWYNKEKEAASSTEKFKFHNSTLQQTQTMKTVKRTGGDERRRKDKTEKRWQGNKEAQNKVVMIGK